MYIPFGQLQHALRLPRSLAKDVLTAYAATDTDHNSAVLVRELEASLTAVEPQHLALVHRYFALMDARDTGALSYRDYCVGAAVLLGLVRRSTFVSSPFGLLGSCPRVGLCCCACTHLCGFRCRCRCCCSVLSVTV